MSLGTKSVELPCRDTEGPVNGVCDGINTLYLLSYRPASNVSLLVVLNGLLQREGADYALSGQTVTFIHAPSAGDRIDFCYHAQFTV